MSLHLSHQQTIAVFDCIMWKVNIYIWTMHAWLLPSFITLSLVTVDTHDRSKTILFHSTLENFYIENVNRKCSDSRISTMQKNVFIPFHNLVYLVIWLCICIYINSNLLYKRVQFFFFRAIKCIYSRVAYNIFH